MCDSEQTNLVICLHGALPRRGILVPQYMGSPQSTTLWGEEESRVPLPKRSFGIVLSALRRGSAPSRFSFLFLAPFCYPVAVLSFYFSCPKIV